MHGRGARLGSGGRRNSGNYSATDEHELELVRIGDDRPGASSFVTRRRHEAADLALDEAAEGRGPFVASASSNGLVADWQA